MEQTVLILYITNVIKQHSENEQSTSLVLPSPVLPQTQDTCILQATLNNIPDLSDPQSDLSNVLIIQTNELSAEKVLRDPPTNWKGTDWLFQFAYHLANDEYLISLDPV